MNFIQNIGLATFLLIAVHSHGQNIPLKRFDIAAVNADIVLSWIVEDSLEDEAFEIQRSTDGSFFETIGVKNISDSLYYEYEDKTVKGFYPVLYYRLRQKRADLFTLYSQIVSIENVNLSAPVPIVFPNPASEMLYLDYTPDKGSWIIVKMADPLGRIIYQSPKINNPRQVHWALSHLPQGRYYLIIVSQTEVFHIPWIKM